MGDSWDDEEFEVPVIAANAISAPTNWDDEEDEVVLDAPVVAKPSATQMEAQLKKLQEEELAFQTKMKLSMLEKETPDEKKLRERRQVEEADNELAGELFSKPTTKASSSTKGLGIGSTVLKTKTDHLTFGTTIAQKLNDSSAYNVAAFYKNLAKTLRNSSMTAEVLDDILSDIQKIRDKHAAETVVQKKVEKKSKKSVKAEEKRHDDIFGWPSNVDKYEDRYGGMEDDKGRS